MLIAAASILTQYRWVAAYIFIVVLCNIGFSVVPLIPMLGVMFPPMALAVGFVFVVRDFAQRDVGHHVLIAMAAAAVISFVMADPYVAAASLVAFVVAETIDWAVYTYDPDRSFRDRVLWSSLISTPIDSAVFLYMIGHFSVTGMILMTLAKLGGALLVWYLHPEPVDTVSAADH